MLSNKDLPALKELHQETSDFVDKLYDWIMPLSLGGEYESLENLRRKLAKEIEQHEGN